MDKNFDPEKPIWNRDIEFKDTRKTWETIEQDDQQKLLALVNIFGKNNPSKQDAGDYLRLQNEMNEKNLGIEFVPYEYFRRKK